MRESCREPGQDQCGSPPPGDINWVTYREFGPILYQQSFESIKCGLFFSEVDHKFSWTKIKQVRTTIVKLVS